MPLPPSIFYSEVDPDPFCIRSCRPEDFDGIVLLLRQLWPEWNADESSVRRIFDEALGSSSQVCLVAVLSDRIVGFGSLSFKNSLWTAALMAHVDELVVDCGCRDKGIGTQLLAALESVARNRGACRIELNSAFRRTEAHEWYKRRGYSGRGIVFFRDLDH